MGLDPSKSASGPSTPRVLATAVALGALSGLVTLSYHALDGSLRGEGFWSYMNLVGAALVQSSAGAGRLSMATAAGTAIFTLMASALSVATATILWPWLRRPMLYRIGAVVLSMGWYYVSFRMIWTDWNPALVLHQPFPGALIGYCILGFCIGLLPRAFEKT